MGLLERYVRWLKVTCKGLGVEILRFAVRLPMFPFDYRSGLKAISGLKAKC